MFNAMIGKSDRQKGKGYATKYNNKVKTFERPLKKLIDCVECFKVVLSEAGAAYMDEFQSVPLGSCSALEKSTSYKITG